jgi:hypothetical protein
MALETATYISELTNTNPTGADPKSQGDDHLRLVKKVILNSFGGFVGTGASPKSITLTEDQINDCAQKAAAATITGLYNFTTEPTINGLIAGTKVIKQNLQNGSYGLLLADSGKSIYKASGGAGETWTIPANTVVAFNLGTVITLVNDGGGDLSIAITTDTMALEGEPATTGTRTLADGGIATIIKVTATKWIIAGGGSLS